VIRRASKEEGKSSIDQIVEEIGIEQWIYLRYFESRKGKGALDREDLVKLVE
jgi:hypothetical protein